jgi:hypothetical protein
VNKKTIASHYKAKKTKFVVSGHPTDPTNFFSFFQQEKLQAWEKK